MRPLSYVFAEHAALCFFVYGLALVIFHLHFFFGVIFKLRHKWRESIQSRRILSLFCISIICILCASPSIVEAKHVNHPKSRSTKSRQALRNAQQKKAALLVQQKKQAQALQALEQKKAAALAQAAQAKQQATSLSKAATQADIKVHHTETTLQTLQSDLTRLAAQKLELVQRLNHYKAVFSTYIPIIERLALYPTDSLLASPLPMEKTVSSILTFHGMIHTIEEQAELITQAENDLHAISEQMDAKNKALQTLLHTQENQKQTLNKQASQAKIAEKHADILAQQTIKDAQQAAQNASSLQEAIANIDKIQQMARKQLEEEELAAKKAHNTARMQEVKSQNAALQTGNGISRHTGTRTAMIPGKILVQWGQKTQSGPASGLTIQTSPQASIRAPCSGRIDFSGNFRSYGNMVILNCGKGYRFILAGFSLITASTGQAISRNQVLGHMPQTSSTLFVQLRSGQKIINPALFL